jgi:hypothetical protein
MVIGGVNEEKEVGMIGDSQEGGGGVRGGVSSVSSEFQQEGLQRRGGHLCPDPAGGPGLLP